MLPSLSDTRDGDAAAGHLHEVGQHGVAESGGDVFAAPVVDRGEGHGGIDERIQALLRPHVPEGGLQQLCFFCQFHRSMALFPLATSSSLAWRVLTMEVHWMIERCHLGMRDSLYREPLFFDEVLRAGSTLACMWPSADMTP